MPFQNATSHHDHGGNGGALSGVLGGASHRCEGLHQQTRRRETGWQRPRRMAPCARGGLLNVNLPRSELVRPSDGHFRGSCCGGTFRASICHAFLPGNRASGYLRNGPQLREDGSSSSGLTLLRRARSKKVDGRRHRLTVGVPEHRDCSWQERSATLFAPPPCALFGPTSHSRCTLSLPSVRRRETPWVSSSGIGYGR